MPPLELSQSQPIDQGALQHLTPAAPDCSFAREVQSQVATMAQPMPGAESMLGMPAVPGAEQAISPLLQMIMRMPGHIGLASSFFEVLGNFFLPQTDMLSIFDPSNFGLHIDLSGVMPEAGGDIDISLLPADAPLMNHLGMANMGTADSFNLASDKLNLSMGGDSHFVSDNGSTHLSMGSQLNVSGSASLAKPQFESAGGVLSGPNMTDNIQANSLASNNRLFSDGAGISNANQTMLASGNAPAAASSSVVNSNASSLSQSVNGGLDNVSAHGSSANNVSYNVFEKLAGNKDILAANNVADSYHSTIGTIQPDAGMDSVAKSASHAPATTGGDLGGLKAKAMTLDGAKVDIKADIKPDVKADHAAAAHPQAHQNIEHKVADAVKPHKAVEHAAAAVKPAQTVSHVSAPRPVAHTAAAAPAAHKIEVVQKMAAMPGEGQFNVADQPAQTAAQAAPAEGAQEFGTPDNNGNVASDNTVQSQTGDVNQTGADGKTLEQQSSVAKTYTIRSGDCLWNIAKDQLGDATKWSDIYKMNSDVLGSNPSMIHPGASIQLPGAEGAAGAGNGIAHYTVKAGDNLWDIAKNQMGDANKWSDLYKANQDIIGSNPDLIRPGQELTFDTGAADPSTTQLSSAGTNAGATTGTNLAQNAAPTGAPGAQAGADVTNVAQNPAGGDIPSINTYETAIEPSTIQSQSAINFDPQPMGQNIQAPQAPAGLNSSMSHGAKVMPVEAQPDGFIPPAHAADLSTAAHSLANGKASVDTSVGTDLMSFLNKKK